jgi:ribosome recycling factor
VIDDTLLEAEEKMEKAVSVAREDLGTLRTGRASPQMFARLVVDYYGSPTPIPQMASINVPEARMAVIKPYDPSQLKAIERVIRDSDLGVNPTDDGTFIRVVFPQLTEERRRDLVKVARHKGEEAKVSIRNVRRHAARRARTRCAARRRSWRRPPRSTSRTSTRSSSTRKPSCSRSEERGPP